MSDATGFPIVVPTGIYREPWVPPWAHAASEDELYYWMLGELKGNIGGTGVQAGWIKLSAGDDGMTETEAKIVRAAARAGAETGAVIGSHTVRGRVVRGQVDLIEKAGYAAGRFIWIHTQAEPDFGIHLEMARRGCWIEYDNIGTPGTDEGHVQNILRVLEAGLGDRLLLSHDRGWYDPGQPGGGVPQPYTYLSETFLPKLAQAGVDEATIRRLTWPIRSRRSRGEGSRTGPPNGEPRGRRPVRHGSGGARSGALDRRRAGVMAGADCAVVAGAGRCGPGGDGRRGCADRRNHAD